MTKQRVLFLCNANSSRSLMGEALLRHMAGDSFDAFSAGSEPDQPHALTLAALEKQGIATDGLASKSLDEFSGQHFAAVIVLCDKAQQACRDWQGSSDEHLYWDIRDPRLIERQNAYDQALGEIRKRLSLWLQIKERDDMQR
ncbi:arsenate reductase ArsC [Halomonas urumqiensis]|uniref:Low molecular weight phosphatase family protein n=1 Tax=Halomonas urumqiensis TaxID=1684789 RepID=A0A2N7UFC3_9GAMM|nr:arsenate reductase ArsC [Halomonas urumqiensis]PMR79169.1 low molecular weight phosphatase family protein [Halomonas urumqiensis]PTB03844.1 arsenate reductase ArsC [Halomonas urumqiensis]GHE19920.1 protein-tyrosine-phosphatase [Halomonas urumqiensis]